MDGKLKETKILINSILTASENSLSLGQLEAEYKMMENEYIPFKEFGFKSLLEFLQSCSDCVRIIHVGGTAQLLPVVGDESRHIRALVENQKKDPSKKVTYKITQPVEENILRLLARTPDHKLPLGRLSSWYLKSYGRPLPAPKGKLVAWLGTSNRFAVLTLERNTKIIEPLSTVDLSKYKRSGSLPESSMNALRNMVQNALSGWGKPSHLGDIQTAPNQQASSASNQGGALSVRNVSEVSSHQTTSWSQSVSSHVNVHTSGYTTASSVPRATQLGVNSWTPQTSQTTIPTQPPARVAPTTTNTAEQVPQSQSKYTQPQPPGPARGQNGLTPEVRQLLINFMMKNPESTSVPALHRAYEYHRGRIDIKTFLNWLISMEECLVIGLDKGRVYMRPEHRPTAARPNLSATTQDPPSRTISPPVTNIPAVSSVACGVAPQETLKITVRTASPTNGCLTNGWQRIVKTSPAACESAPSSAATQPELEIEDASAREGNVGNNLDDSDRVLEGISGLCVTDIIDVVEMMRRRPKIPLDQLLSDFEETYQKTIEPNDGVEGLVDNLSRLGLLKVAPNSDVSLFSSVRLRTFGYAPGHWLDVTNDDAFWNKFIEDGILTEGISVDGKVASYNETGFTFAPNWCPPDHLYGRAEIKAGGEYIYSNGEQKFKAVANSSISMAGHWLIYLPDLKKFKPCRREQLFVGPPQPVFDVIPVGRFPPIGEDVKLKIIQVAPTMTFACINDEEPCCYVKSKVDPNFNFRVLHWDNQRFIPREDLAKLSLDKGLTSMDSSAIGHGEYFAACSWMGDIVDPFFIPMIELVELLETEGFREDAIHDLLLI